jgi:LAS superfamily LD-carboxypeptidase LdcB
VGKNMANNYEDFDALNEMLRRSKELSEERYAAEEGYVRRADGSYKALESQFEKRSKIELKLNEELEAQLGKNTTLQNKRQAIFDKEMENMGYLIKSNGEFVKTTVELTVEQRKTLANYRDINDKTEKLAKTLDAPGKAFNELSSRLNSTKAIVGEFSNRILESTKGSMGMTAAVQLGTAAFEGIFKAATAMTKSLYEGERGAKVGAKAVSAFADSISTALKGIGAAMMFIPGLGIAARIAGGAIALLGVAVEAAAEANRIAAEQNDKLYESFTKLSEAGLAGAKGMTGVFEMVQTLGMTTAELEKFNTLLASNARDLKLFGTTAATGANKFASVAGELVKSDVGQKLEMLGVTADQQREHTLQYMAQQTRMGMMQGKSQQDLVKGASAYVEELDKLAMLSGATRKQQEESRAAVMAEEELRAAMLQAEIDGDTTRQKQLEGIAKYAAYLRDSGDTRGSTGVTRYGAAGGPIDDASAAAMMTYGKGIQAALDGKPIAEVIKQGNESSKETLKQMAGTKTVGGDTSGILTGKFGNLVDNTKMIDAATKLSEKSGKSFDESLSQLQKERQGTDQVTKDNIEGRRLQQSAAQQLDSVVFSFNAAAKLNKTASDTFNSAVTKFNETVGAKPVSGGNIKTTKSSGSSDTSTTPVPPPISPESPESPVSPESPSSPVTAKTPAPVATRSITPTPTPVATPVATRSITPTPTPVATPVSMGNEGRRSATTAPVAASITASTAKPVSMSNEGKRSETAALTATPTTSISEVIKGIETLFTFGSRSGSKSNFEQLNDSIKSKIINAAKEFKSMTGSTISINSAKRDPEDQQRLWDESVAAGRPGKTAKNMPIGRPGTSKHERGFAVDIQNYNDPKAVDAMNKQGLFQTVPKDPVHFEMARFGGVFKGPASGYPVMLHEEEVAMPKPQFDELANGVQKESVTTATHNLGSNSDNLADSPSAILQELIVLMEDKFDTMISKLSDGNDISDKLLRNAMV